MSGLKRDYWQVDLLRKAAKLLSAAADNLYTTYPHSSSRPCPDTLPAVKTMLETVVACIEQAQPTKDGTQS